MTKETSEAQTPIVTESDAVNRRVRPAAGTVDACAELFENGVPRPEHPRPQLVRPEWTVLNGVWEFAFDERDEGLQQSWMTRKQPLRRTILVPFAHQTALSGHEETGVFEVVWYARDFEVPADWREGENRVLLHFEAVDYICTVWVNGREVGHNRGGHVPFSFDISSYLHDGIAGDDASDDSAKSNINRVCLRVQDSQDPAQPRGKQAVRARAQGCEYFCTTGIWGSVWLERVPSARIQELKLTPRLGTDSPDTLEVEVLLHAPALGWHLEVELLESLEDETVVARAHNDAAGSVARLLLTIPDAKRWSPDAPHLYGLRVRMSKDGEVLDEVRSYAGIREVQLRGGKFCLNGEPLYLKMVLDQGYWPDGGMTAPSDKAIRADVEWCKAFGFNGARKHQKVEERRWLYHCDQLGLMVWGEMANARAWSDRAEELFLAEWERAVRRDINSPCIVTWVPLNESWGVPHLGSGHGGQLAFVERMVALTRRLDATRPVVDNDGWEHLDIADIATIHDYSSGPILRERYKNGMPTRSASSENAKSGVAVWAPGASYRGQPVMLTEVGGFLTIPPGETQLDRLYQAYGVCRSPEELLEKYASLMQGLSALPEVCGFCYTQLTDIEQEQNGLLSPDRRPKVEAEKVAELHRLFDHHFNRETTG